MSRKHLLWLVSFFGLIMLMAVGSNVLADRTRAFVGTIDARSTQNYAQEIAALAIKEMPIILHPPQVNPEAGQGAVQGVTAVASSPTPNVVVPGPEVKGAQDHKKRCHRFYKKYCWIKPLPPVVPVPEPINPPIPIDPPVCPPCHPYEVNNLTIYCPMATTQSFLCAI